MKIMVTIITIILVIVWLFLLVGPTITFKPFSFSMPNWITKAGKKVKVPDLDDKHVSNIIAAMRRGDIKCDKSLIDFFELELAYRENNR